MVNESFKKRLKLLAGIIKEEEGALPSSGDLFNLWKTDKNQYKKSTDDLIDKYQKGEYKEVIKSVFVDYFTSKNTKVLDALNNYNKEITNKEGSDFWLLSLLNSLSGKPLSPDERKSTGMNHISNFDLLQSYKPGEKTIDDYLFSTLENSLRQYFKLDKNKVNTISQSKSEDSNELGNVDFWDPDVIDLGETPSGIELSNDIKTLNSEDAQTLYNATKSIQKMALEYLKTVEYGNSKSAINWYEDNTVEGEDAKQLISWIPNWERYNFPKIVYHNWIRSIIIPEYFKNKLKIDIPGYTDIGSQKEIYKSNFAVKKYLKNLQKTNKDLFVIADKMEKGILGKNQNIIDDVLKNISKEKGNLVNLITIDSYPNSKLGDFVSDKSLIENIIEIARGTINMLPQNSLSITNYDKTNQGNYFEGWVSKNKDRINALVSDDLFRKMISLTSKKPKTEPKVYRDENDLKGAKDFYRALAIVNFKWKDAVRQAKERERAPKKNKDSTGIPTDNFGGMFESSSQKF